jgi:hypothetical protein
MQPIQIFGLGIKSKSSNVTSQTRLNVYLEHITDGEKTRTAGYGIHGLTLFTDFGDTPARCMHVFGDYVYMVHRGSFYQVNNAGVRISKGTLLTTSGRVGVADNGTQIMLVDGTYGYIYNTSTDVFVRITDADFPGADTVTFIDGYFVVNKPATGQFYISSLYDGLLWDALDFATAESNPDKLVGVYSDHGTLILHGDLTSETWVNTGALDFPFAKVQGAVLESGLAARWSVAKFDQSIVWLAKNRLGETQVIRFMGGAVVKISTTDLETIINGYGNISNATAFSYLYKGHPFYQINFTSASWLYDGMTQMWSQLKSEGIDRQRSEIAVNYINRTLVSDYSSGKIYNIDSTAYTENGAMIVSELTSKHVFSNLEQYAIGKLQVDCEAGTGLATGQGTDPQMMLQVSRDGGHTWGVEQWRSMGKLGEYKTRAQWTRLGQARDWVFRIRISDPIKRVILGAWVDGE